MRDGHVIEGVRRGPLVRIELDGRDVTVHEGESVAAALLSEDQLTCRLTRVGQQARGYYCGMGVCFECVVHVEGLGEVRACRTAVVKGMRVRTLA